MRTRVVAFGCALALACAAAGALAPSAFAYYVKHPGGSWDYAVVLSRPSEKPTMRSVLIADETTAAPAVYLDENCFRTQFTSAGEVVWMAPPLVPSSGYYGWAAGEPETFHGSIAPTTTGSKGGYLTLFIDHIQTFQRDSTYGYWTDGLGLDFGSKNNVTTSTAGRYVSASWGPGQDDFGSYSPVPSRSSTPTPSQRWKAEAWSAVMVAGVRNADGGMRNRWNVEAAVYDPQGYNESIAEHGQRNIWASVDTSENPQWVQYIQSTSSLPTTWRFAPVNPINKFPWNTTETLVQATSELTTEAAQALYGRFDVDTYAAVVASEVVPAAAAGGIAGVSKEESGTVPSEVTSTSIAPEFGLPGWMTGWFNTKMLDPLKKAGTDMAGSVLWPVKVFQSMTGDE